MLRRATSRRRAGFDSQAGRRSTTVPCCAAQHRGVALGSIPLKTDCEAGLPASQFAHFHEVGCTDRVRVVPSENGFAPWGRPHSLPSGSFRARVSVRSGRLETVVDRRTGLPKIRGREGPSSSSREAAVASWKTAASGVGSGMPGLPGIEEPGVMKTPPSPTSQTPCNPFVNRSSGESGPGQAASCHEGAIKRWSIEVVLRDAGGGRRLRLGYGGTVQESQTAEDGPP